MLILASFAAAIIAGVLYDAGNSTGLCVAFAAIGVVCLLGGLIQYLDKGDFK